jgi:hypothetical protein
MNIIIVDKTSSGKTKFDHSSLSSNMNIATGINNFNISTRITNRLDTIDYNIDELDENLNVFSTGVDLQKVYNNSLTGSMELDVIKGYSIDAGGDELIDINHINNNTWNVLLNKIEYLTFNITSKPVVFNPLGNVLYTKLDNNLYMLNANGVETLIGGGGDSSTVPLEFLTSTDVLDIESGQFIFNNINQDNTTEITINVIDYGNYNRNILYSLITIESDIYIKNDTETNEKLFNVTGVPVLDGINYKIPVSFTNSIGEDFNNMEVLNITFINRINPFNQSLNTIDTVKFDGIDLTNELDMNVNDIVHVNSINGIDPDQITLNQTNIDTLETKTQNQSATGINTTFTDLIINGIPITTNTDYTDSKTLITQSYLSNVDNYGPIIYFGGRASSVNDDLKYFELYGKSTSNVTTTNIDTVFVSPLNCTIYSISWIKENNNSSGIEIVKNENEGIHSHTLSGLSGVLSLSITVMQGDRIEILYKNNALFPGNSKIWIQTTTTMLDVSIPSVSNLITKTNPDGDDWTVFNSYMYLDYPGSTIKTSRSINVV